VGRNLQVHLSNRVTFGMNTLSVMVPELSLSREKPVLPLRAFVIRTQEILTLEAKYLEIPSAPARYKSLSSYGGRCQQTKLYQSREGMLQAAQSR
jgi:hypothetical protein